MSRIDHSLTAADAQAMIALREVIAKRPPPPALRAEMRAQYDIMTQLTPDAEGISYDLETIGGISGIWCRPRDARTGAAMLFLHGGAYFLGAAQAYRQFAGQLAVRAGIATFAADYRLAPEHPFPAAVHDAFAVYRGLATHGVHGAHEIVVAGDSAGGGLALATLMLARDAARRGEIVAPHAGIVLSAWTDLTNSGASFRERVNADPLLKPPMLTASAADYLQGASALDPLASPLFGDPFGLPRLQLHVGTDELLLDDSLRYEERASAAGVRAEVHVWDGMPHVFQRYVGTLEAAGASLDLAGAFLREG